MNISLIVIVVIILGTALFFTGMQAEKNKWILLLTKDVDPDVQVVDVTLRVCTDDTYFSTKVIAVEPH